MSDKELTKRQENTIMGFDYGEDAGQGFDHQTNEDIALPFIGILEVLSPQLDENDGRFIEGAKKGQLVNSLTQEVCDRLLFQPVDTEHCYVEWVPRDHGGGFRGKHDINSAVVAKAKSESADGFRLKLGENELEETFYMYGILLDEDDPDKPGLPACIPFTSTRIKSYKKINTPMRTVKGNPPLYAFRLEVKTKSEKNNKGNYYIYDIDFLGGSAGASAVNPASELYVHAKDFFAGLRAGEQKIDYNAGKSQSPTKNASAAAADGGEAPDDDMPF